MSRFALARRNETDFPKCYGIDGLSFSMLTKEEIIKISATKIHTPLGLDPLGHPLTGGLYDKLLGPLSERSEPCGTCRKSFHHCPGHFGYVELPLPVVNPICHKGVGNILRLSCLSCYRIQVPYHVREMGTLQIKLLDCGLVAEAMEVSDIISSLISTYKSLENAPESATQPIKKYQELIEKTSAELGRKYILNKTTEGLRNQFLNTILKDAKADNVCLFCKNKIDRIQVLRDRVIVNPSKGPSDESIIGSVKPAKNKCINPEESRSYMRKIWENDAELLGLIVGLLNKVNEHEHPTDVFYMDVIPVLPPNHRPVSIIGDRISEHSLTKMYKLVIENILMLKLMIQIVKNQGDISNLSSEAKGAYNFAQGTTPIEKLNFAWESVQYGVNLLLDNNNTRLIQGEGLKQFIEKKEGIIRMHMMGKRVNYSARSVITPDPSINIDEVGIPEKFAKSLTYPVPVTPWNVEELRKLVRNGPNVHPGATMVEYEDGSIRRLLPNDELQRESILKCLLTPYDKDFSFRGLKKVHRHLTHGDIVLLNRQPTLHRPSIMAHTVRVMKDNETIKLHYANCKAYNADFDGDEMNIHFPQNEVARAEAYNLVNVSNHYIVPKDGTPLSGLIQDHIVVGVKLALRGRFFTEEEYNHLVFQSLPFKINGFIYLTPSILKPKILWSGKQILSSVIINILPRDKKLINLVSTAKIPSKDWQIEEPREWKAGGTPFKDPNTMTETEVIIRNGELLVGILDKSHYGPTPYSLIHCVHEIYGPKYATQLLSAFSKLFTICLQREGFTLGIRDIMITSRADKKREKIIKKSENVGMEVMIKALGLPENTPVEDVVVELSKRDITNPKLASIVDKHFKSVADSVTNEINKSCLSEGLVSKFPQNNLQTMVHSGAKGSTVNFMQMTCLLGQIELEGKRPPRMSSGKTLPSFPITNFSLKAGGFVTGRFLTGICPQEFFFHSMAGREGLIDTAVKTSRTGYLQRCIIKTMEGLQVAYDMTVRDADNSVIQFQYGEDGMDISKAQFLNEKQMDFLYENRKALIDKDEVRELKDRDYKNVKNYRKKMLEAKENSESKTKGYRSPFTLFSEVVNQKMEEEKGGVRLNRKQMEKIWKMSDEDVKGNFKKLCARRPDPVNSVFQSDRCFGSINERIDALLSKYKCDNEKEKRKFEIAVKLKAMKSLSTPGEPVGLLAAQSIGEPSTQMTLNTFHFAGRGEMNVTLGIPRLREIIMTASKEIKTPAMEIPFLPVPDLEDKAETLRKTFTKVFVADVLKKVVTSEEITISPRREHRYTVTFIFWPREQYKHMYCVKPKQILKHMSRKFFRQMFVAIRKFLNIKVSQCWTDIKATRRTNNAEEDEGNNDNQQEPTNADENSSDDEDADPDDAKHKRQDESNYQEPDIEEKEQSDDEYNEEDEEGTPKESSEKTEEDEVVSAHNFAQNYSYDKNDRLWCTLTFALPVNYRHVYVEEIVKSVAEKSVIWEVPNIKKAITYMKDNRLMLRTEGINILEMFKYPHLLNLNHIYTNDFHKMAEIYGIEAASKVLTKEIVDVFSVYGIKIDHRHLSLISDYMTYNGTIEPMSRRGMSSSPSSLQQVSFESSLAFLQTAVLRGKTDSLENPSARLMVGLPVKNGTNCFSLLHKFR